MTSGQVENALWKKIQSEMSNGNMLAQDGKMSGVGQSSEKHQISLNELMGQGQARMNNMNTLNNLNELLMQKSQSQFTNRMNQNLNHREIGIIEKIMNGYGLIKCMNRDAALFFQYNSNLDIFKIGDYVEFNESLDKNNKPIAVNLVKMPSNDPRITNKVNLKDLLFAQNQVFYQQQSNYENLVNELKKFKIQQQVQNGNNVLNKENFFNQSNNNQQNNILNMTKFSSIHQSSSLPDFKSLSSDYCEGTIAIAANQHQNPYNAEGRIVYQRSGESFFIPYQLSDLVHPSIQLRPGDQVKFYISQRSINNMVSFYASKVELLDQFSNQLNRVQIGQKHRGIICWLKDSFGKIDREDQAKETFFHFTDYKGDIPMNELRIGSSVEFEIQDRYGKEIAVNIKSIPNGSVCLDELSQTVYVGRITAPPQYNSAGRLIYDGNNSQNLIELTFTERDRINGASEYTFLEGDFVQFRIATDKRKSDKLTSQRATQLTLIEEYSLADNCSNTNERRLTGILVKISNKYGAIQHSDRDDLIFFSLCELISFVKLATDSVTYTINKTNIQIGDVLEFSVVQCARDQVFVNGLKAIRVIKQKINPQFNSNKIFNGWIEKEANQTDYGSIKYEISSNKTETISYKLVESGDKKGSAKNLFNKGDKVQFTILDQKFASNIKLIEPKKQYGYVTMLKDNYGFIEINMFDEIYSKHSKSSKDIFFHFSSFKDDLNSLSVGDEVEFTVNRKNKQKLAAENVTKLTENSQISKKPLPGLSKGKIIQLLRSHNQSSDQSGEYYGKIQVISDSGKKESNYHYGLFSLIDKKTPLQLGDLVSFQLIEISDGTKKAFNVMLVQSAPTDHLERNDKQAKIKELKKGKIESLKGHCGYIEYTIGSDSKKIFFHVSDLSDSKSQDSVDFKAGDEVEFHLSNRNGKLSATKIKKIASGTNTVKKAETQNEQRPDRLVTKLKLANIDNQNGKQFILIRGPVNPDGKAKSFAKKLIERAPGTIPNDN